MKRLKTIRKIGFLGFIATLLIISISCKKSNTAPTSKLAVSISTVKNLVTTKGYSTTISGIVLNSVKISIADLVIEENSGNDVEQQGNSNDGGGDNENNKKEGTGSEASDILLAGPFVLEVIDGNESIGDVDVFPGTFKKVDFTFLPDNGLEFSGNSLIIKCGYTDANGIVIPVTIKSAFDQKVQLPLANGGVTVASNNKVSLKIVLDIQTWINDINLSSALVTNGAILIDNTNNVELLKLFNTSLASKIEVNEKE